MVDQHFEGSAAHPGKPMKLTRAEIAMSIPAILTTLGAKSLLEASGGERAYFANAVDLVNGLLERRALERAERRLTGNSSERKTMTFKINKKVFERHVTKEIRTLQAYPTTLEGRFALQTEDDYQVQLVVTREPYNFMPEENPFIIEACSTPTRTEDNHTGNVVNQMTGDEARAVLEKIMAEFQIGSKAATETTLLTNVQNAVRRSKCLSAVEHYLTKTGEDSELQPDEDDEVAADDCPLRWGETRQQYIQRFRTQFPELEGVGSRHNSN